MKFEVIGFDDKELWEKLTKGREVYYQWQYVDAFFKKGDGIPKLAYALSGKDCAINVFFLRNINKDLEIKDNSKQYYDIITPYGYGGVDYNGSNKKLLNFFFEKYEDYCMKNNIVSEFLRLCPFTNNYKNYGNEYDLSNISKTIYMKLNNPTQIWNDMEGRSRTTIRKASKSNLEIKSDFSKDMLDNFKMIYYETMVRDNADSCYFFNDAFFKSIYQNLKKFAKIYTVYHDDKPISSSIVLFNGKSAHYHLSGTLSEFMKYGANNLALYKIALDLCEKGYKTFHLGGGYGGDDSPLFKFKKSFNKFGELDFYIGKRIFNQKKYDELCKMAGVKKDESFFPAYRKQQS